MRMDAHSHALAQLACSRGYRTTWYSSSVLVTTGYADSDIPTYNALGPVTCVLTLTATDALGQTRVAAANITVSTARNGGHAWAKALCLAPLLTVKPTPFKRPVSSPSCEARGLETQSASSNQASKINANGWTFPPCAVGHHVQVTNPPPPVPVITSSSLSMVAPNPFPVNSDAGNCTAEPCDIEWTVTGARQLPCRDLSCATSGGRLECARHNTMLHAVLSIRAQSTRHPDALSR